MFPIFGYLIIALAIVIERTIETGLSEKYFLRWKLEEMLAHVSQGVEDFIFET
jgi:hypothetical protein